VPNCAPLSSAPTGEPTAASREADEVRFLFQGGFAPGRGLEELITAWKHVNPKAKLLLRGPDGVYKDSLIELAKALGILDETIIFPSPVAEEQLISAAREADVGLIPYQPRCLNNRYACPKKLSQYMAAGLPIISNELDYVKSIVVDNRVGVAVDHSDTGALIQVIDRFTTSKQEIAEMSRRALALFESKINWEAVSRDLYQQIWEAVRKKPSLSRSELNFTWITDGQEMCRSVEDLGSAATFFPQTVNIWRAEIARLNEVYRAEIARLNEVYPAEIARLNEVYPAEIARLNEVYRAEIARLNEVYPAEIARLNEAYRAEVPASRPRRLKNDLYRIGRYVKAQIRKALRVLGMRCA
jgi:hypothetical protein